MREERMEFIVRFLSCLALLRCGARAEEKKLWKREKIALL